MRGPKYACRECDGEAAQAPAPEHLIEGCIPTEALHRGRGHRQITRDHLPLYRQVARSMAARASNLTAGRWPTGLGVPAFAATARHYERSVLMSLKGLG